jgi:hypothetical protein
MYLCLLEVADDLPISNLKTLVFRAVIIENNSPSVSTPSMSVMIAFTLLAF